MLILIPVKTLTNCFMQSLLGVDPTSQLNCLEPRSRRVLKIEGSKTQFQSITHPINLKIQLATILPEPRVLAIELGKLELGFGTSTNRARLMLR
jgi:hypothetical protein